MSLLRQCNRDTLVCFWCPIFPLACGTKCTTGRRIAAYWWCILCRGQAETSCVKSKEAHFCIHGNYQATAREVRGRIAKRIHCDYHATASLLTVFRALRENVVFSDILAAFSLVIPLLFNVSSHDDHSQGRSQNSSGRGVNPFSEKTHDLFFWIFHCSSGRRSNKTSLPHTIPLFFC